MNQPPNILDLPEEDLAAFLATLRKNYNEARQALEKVNEDIAQLTEKQRGLIDKVSRYQVFVSYSYQGLPEAKEEAQAQPQPLEPAALPPEVPTPLQSDDTAPIVDSEYAKLPTQYEKIIYVTNNPQKYGKLSFVGAKSVIEALRQEEPELADVPDDVMMKRIGPALSHLGGTAQRLIKLAEKKHRLNVHYLSADWFENGVLKSEHEQALRPFDLVPVPAKRDNNQLALPEPKEKLSVEAVEKLGPGAPEATVE